MKKSKKKSPIWPYLGILACLFLLSVTAPRAWDRRQRASLPPAAESKQAAARVDAQEAKPAITSDVVYGGAEEPLAAQPRVEEADAKRTESDEQVCFEHEQSLAEPELAEPAIAAPAPAEQEVSVVETQQPIAESAP